MQYSSLLQSGSVSINGVAYYQILLDANEPNTASIITLDMLKIYTSATGSQTTLNVSTLGTLRYDLDASGDSQVIIAAARSHGSRSGDVNVYILVSDFAGTSPSDYFYPTPRSLRLT